MKRKKHDGQAIDALIEALSQKDVDLSTLAIHEADVALLTYARKLTIAPATIKESDVQALRKAGFDDLAIHDLCCVTAYFAFVNRIADGLGVELELV